MYRLFFFAGIVLALAAALTFASSRQGEAQIATPVAEGSPTPTPTATSSVPNPIQHVVIIVKENRSFDQFPVRMARLPGCCRADGK